MEPCDDNSTQKKSVQFKDRDINSATPAEIAVAVLVVLFVLLLLGLTLYFCRSRLCLCCGGARKGDALLHDQHGAEMSRV
jgi:phosphoglycerate-specific signal transduction histidine kinase